MELIDWPHNLAQCIADDVRGARTWQEFTEVRERLRDFSTQVVRYAMTKGLPGVSFDDGLYIPPGANGWLDFIRYATPAAMGEAMLELDCQGAR